MLNLILMCGLQDEGLVHLNGAVVHMYLSWCTTGVQMYVMNVCILCHGTIISCQSATVTSQTVNVLLVTSQTHSHNKCPDL